MALTVEERVEIREAISENLQQLHRDIARSVGQGLNLAAQKVTSPVVTSMATVEATGTDTLNNTVDIVYDNDPTNTAVSVQVLGIAAVGQRGIMLGIPGGGEYFVGLGIGAPGGSTTPPSGALLGSVANITTDLTTIDSTAVNGPGVLQLATTFTQDTVAKNLVGVALLTNVNQEVTFRPLANATISPGGSTTSVLTCTTANFIDADVGATISGTGVPPFTSITSINNPTSVNVSSAFNFTAGTGLSLTLSFFTPEGGYASPWFDGTHGYPSIMQGPYGHMSTQGVTQFDVSDVDMPVIFQSFEVFKNQPGTPVSFATSAMFNLSPQIVADGAACQFAANIGSFLPLPDVAPDFLLSPYGQPMQGGFCDDPWYGTINGGSLHNNAASGNDLLSSVGFWSLPVLYGDVTMATRVDFLANEIQAWTDTPTSITVHTPVLDRHVGFMAQRSTFATNNLSAVFNNSVEFLDVDRTFTAPPFKDAGFVGIIGAGGAAISMNHNYTLNFANATAGAMLQGNNTWSYKQSMSAVGHGALVQNAATYKNAVRTITAAAVLSSGSTTSVVSCTTGNFTTADVGATLKGSGVPAGTTIASIINSVAVNATAPTNFTAGTGLTITVAANVAFTDVYGAIMNQTITGDTGTLTLNGHFIDYASWPTYGTLNGGTISGGFNAHIGFSSKLIVNAGVGFFSRVGFEVFDATGSGTLASQIGFLAPYMTASAASIGLVNGSRTVYTPTTQAVTNSVGVTTDSSYVIMTTPGSAVTLPTPNLSAGIIAGQVIRIFNGGPNSVTFTNGFGVFLGPIPTLTLVAGESASFTWSQYGLVSTLWTLESAHGTTSSDGLGEWKKPNNIGIRAALGNCQVPLISTQPDTTPPHPAKIAIIADSEGEEALTFNPFIADIMARYPSTSPSPLHIQGGFNGGNVLYLWTGTGTFTTGRGASGHLATLTTGQTLQTSPALPGDVEYGDRIRIHYLPNVGTFHVTIDGVAAVGADGVNTGTTAVDTTANARDVSGFNIGTSVVAGSEYQLTSFGQFTEDMVGSIVTCANLPVGTRVVAYSSTSVVYVDQQATATGVLPASFARPSWTSQKLEKGPHTVVVTGASGTVKIDGIFYYQGNYNTQGGVQVHLISQSGWRTDDFYALSGGPATSAVGSPVGHVSVSNTDLQRYLADEGFDAVIFETGTNDQSIALYQANMPLLVAATVASLPRVEPVLWVPEPKIGRTFMSGLPPIASSIAQSVGGLIADMNTIAPDLSGTPSGHPDPRYALTIDGTHYSVAGQRLASEVLLSALDGGVSRGAQMYAPFVGQTGTVATAVSEQNGSTTGYAIFESISQTNPDLFMGHWGVAYGFMAGDPAGTSFAPDTFLLRNSAGAWSTNNSSIATGTAAVTGASFGLTGSPIGFTSTAALFDNAVIAGTLNSTGVTTLATSNYGTKTASFDAVTLATGATVTMATNTGINFTQLRLNPAVTLSSLTDIAYGINLSGSVTTTTGLVAGMHQGFTDSTTLQATTGSASIFTGTPVSFVANPTIKTQDTNAQTLTSYKGYVSQPVLSVFAAGSLIVTSLFQYDAPAVTVPTGATVTALTAYHVGAPSISGTVTTWTGLDIPAVTAAGTNVGIKNLSSLLQQGGLVLTPTTVTVTANAGTVPVTASNATFTNSSAAAMTITLATTGASNGQVTIVRIYDATNVVQNITWTNTENSGATVPLTSNASTTSPKTVVFQFNSGTSKWRCIISV